jgi:fatty acid desaturase
MGEAKRRAAQGLPPRQPKRDRRPVDDSPRIAPWLPLTRNQADRFVSLTTRGAWIGIAALVVFWVTVRFIGPAAGWWTLLDG